MKMNPYIQHGYDDKLADLPDNSFLYYGPARALYLFGRQYAEQHQTLAHTTTMNGLVAK
mgnify:CR=1 FL=1